MEIIHKIRNKIGLHNIGRITYEEDSTRIGSTHLPRFSDSSTTEGQKQDVEPFAYWSLDERTPN